MFRMSKILAVVIPAAVLLGACALPGNAAPLVGSSVSGALYFSGGSTNLFDPAQGFVPVSGYLNIAGTTVTISNSAVEFGFDDGGNRDSADFSSTQLKVSDLVEVAAGPSFPFQMTFTDTAFKGARFTSVSDNFPLTYSLAGDVLTLNYAGGTVTTGETLDAVFSFTPSPEPSTAGLVFASGLAALAIFLARNRRLKKRTSDAHSCGGF